MKKETIITGLSILALSIVATTFTNGIYVVGLFLIASCLAFIVRILALKFQLESLVSIIMLVSVLTALRLGFSVIEPTIAQQPSIVGIGFLPILITMVLPNECVFNTKEIGVAIFTIASAIIVISVMVELLATGYAFGINLRFIEPSSFFQTPAGILFIAATVIACTQIRSRGEQK
ncbi:MAG: hypothetical protein ACRDAO_02455 [Culicoidibacterales bacterium]